MSPSERAVARLAKRRAELVDRIDRTRRGEDAASESYRRRRERLLDFERRRGEASYAPENLPEADGLWGALYSAQASATGLSATRRRAEEDLDRLERFGSIELDRLTAEEERFARLRAEREAEREAAPPRTTVRDRVLAALADAGESHFRALAESVGAKPDTVSWYLNRAAKDGDARRVSPGVYAPA